MIFHKVSGLESKSFQLYVKHSLQSKVRSLLVYVYIAEITVRTAETYVTIGKIPCKIYMVLKVESLSEGFQYPNKVL